MKSIKIAGLCLVSMLMMSMALASAASAAPLWLLCLEGTATTKYSSNQCNKAESGGKWESVALGTKSDTVKIVAFSLRLSDTGAGTEVECPGPGSKGWGLIENSNKGVIKVAEVEKPETNCKVLKAGLLESCKKIEEVKGADLPWKTEVFETESKFLTKIEADGNGEPGWTVKCSGTTDTCLAEAGKAESVELVNGVTSGVLLVLGRFEEKEPAKCSLFGGSTGHVSGLVAILLWNGNGLSINKV